MEQVALSPPLGLICENTGWQANLELGFERRRGSTVLVSRRRSGPLSIQRPFYPEGANCCHVILLHPPSGVVGGDSLSISLSSDRDARVLATTPGAGKFYRSAGPKATQQVGLKVDKGGSMEWLPQETIVHDGAIAKMSLDVDLAGGANFLGWEILCLGCPASNEPFERGEIVQSIRLRREGRLIFNERASYKAGATVMSAPWGLRSQPVTATMLSTGANAETLAAVREVFDGVTCREGELFAATLIDDLLLCRYLGEEAQRARELFEHVWQVLRPLTVGEKATRPRIWNT